MPRRSAPLQINQFTGGLNTDASPLNFPVESSKDELNLNLNRDGSRQKRLGFDYETDFTIYNSGVVPNSNLNLGRSMYKWDNAGGDPEKSLLVVQVGCTLNVFDFDNEPVSSSQVYTRTYSENCYDNSFSYATIDGLLVVCNGEKAVYVYEYDSGTITESEETLYIRDLFGVQAFDGATDVTLPQNLNQRVNTLTDEHTYNLRNQGFNRSWFINNTETAGDPISAFYTDSGNTVYPSNADNINLTIYSDPNDSNNRLVERFFSQNLFEEKPNNTQAPVGSFIIDALERGDSREAQETAMRTKDPDLSLAVSSLPTDKTPNGASVVAEYSGHVFFAGFSGQVEGGDSKSPRMSSYVLFSLRVADVSDIGRCYQVADPTDLNDSVLVDTDGGFIRIENSYNINNMVSLNGYLFVFAENGVWAISGTDTTAFSAVNYEVDKISRRGCVSPTSVVFTDEEIYYWGDDGIYVVSFNQFGQPVVQSVSEDKIQKEYLETITLKQRQNAAGSYDSFQKQVRWVYTDLEDGEFSEELIYSTKFGAFLKNKVNPMSANFPKVYSVAESVPFVIGTSVSDVTVQGVDVTVNAEDVTVTSTVRTNQIRENIYLVITDISGTISYTLGKYFDSSGYDWSQIMQTEYESYLETGALTLGEPRSKKQTPTVWTFFNKTETGISPSTFEPINPSSCLISGRFDWSNSNASNKWSTPRQAYRVTKLFLSDTDFDFDTGFNLIKTRNRIRGFGNSGSLRFEGEAGKDMHLYGWAFDMFASGEE